jgi:hypothetical protein
MTSAPKFKLPTLCSWPCWDPWCAMSHSIDTGVDEKDDNMQRLPPNNRRRSRLALVETDVDIPDTSSLVLNRTGVSPTAPIATQFAQSRSYASFGVTPPNGSHLWPPMFSLPGHSQPFLFSLPSRQIQAGPTDHLHRSRRPIPDQAAPSSSPTATPRLNLVDAMSIDGHLPEAPSFVHEPAYDTFY